MNDKKTMVAMDLATILSSRSQRRQFLLATSVVLVGGSVSAMLLAHCAPQTPVWTAFVGLLMSVAASGIFALLAGLYVWYFFSDPAELAAKTYVFANDIAENLEDVARSGSDYRIFVRTGRHFRAKILPILVEKSRAAKSPLRLEVALLDFRNEGLCERYSRYRKASSFDQNAWSAAYVRTEVMATLLMVLKAVNENSGLINADLYLSGRLSTFRIEGSADTLIVTREDPKDAAYRYRTGQPEFAAYSAELRWILDESERVVSSTGEPLPSSLSELFGKDVVKSTWEIAANAATGAPSPYVR